MRTTIKDIADELNISVATVSNVFNGKGRVGEETAEKVHEVAKRLNYSRNELASRLVSQRSMTIGVFVFDTGIIVDADVHVAYRAIRTYLDQLRKKNFDLLLFSVDDMNDKQDILEVCMGRLVEGVIVLWPMKENKIKNLLHSPLPTIVVERNYRGNFTASIHFDNNKGISLALEHLLSLGHREIGFVKEIDATHVAMERYNAFATQMKQKKLFHKDFIYESHFTLEDGWNVGKRILQNKHLPTAIICSADLIAIGMIRSFEEQGVRVPEDISILGYDGLKLGQFMHKRLTSIKQDFKKMAIKTIEMLFSMVDEKTEVKNEIIPVELIIGETTASVNSCAKGSG